MASMTVDMAGIRRRSVCGKAEGITHGLAAGYEEDVSLGLLKENLGPMHGRQGWTDQGKNRVGLPTVAEKQ